MFILVYKVGMVGAVVRYLLSKLLRSISVLLYYRRRNFFLSKPVICESFKSHWITMRNFFRIFYVKKLLRKLVKSAKETSRYLALFCFQIYAPSYYFACSTIFILICDERAEVFPLQPRSVKVTNLNSLPVLLLLVHNILLPAKRLVAGNSETYLSARDVLSSNMRTRKMDFDSWYITIIDRKREERCETVNNIKVKSKVEKKLTSDNLIIKHWDVNLFIRSHQCTTTRFCLAQRPPSQQKPHW